MASRRGVVLSPGAARKIGEATTRVRQTIHPTDPRRASGVLGGWNPGILRATVTTAIPTGTISSPSTTGAATIYRWDPIAATSSADAIMTGVRICNDHTLSASIATGKTIKVAWIDGDFWLVAADC